MSKQAHKPARLAAIEALPTVMQDDALVDWETVAALANLRDPEYVREMVIEAGVPLVHVSARRKLPRWGAVREWLRSRERVCGEAA